MTDWLTDLLTDTGSWRRTPKVWCQCCEMERLGSKIQTRLLSILRRSILTFLSRHHLNSNTCEFKELLCIPPSPFTTITPSELDNLQQQPVAPLSKLFIWNSSSLLHQHLSCESAAIFFCFKGTITCILSRKQKDWFFFDLYVGELLWFCSGLNVFQAFTSYLKVKNPDDKSKDELLKELAALDEHLRAHVS